MVLDVVLKTPYGLAFNSGFETSTVATSAAAMMISLAQMSTGIPGNAFAFRPGMTRLRATPREAPIAGVPCVKPSTYNSIGSLRGDITIAGFAIAVGMLCSLAKSFTIHSERLFVNVYELGCPPFNRLKTSPL